MANDVTFQREEYKNSLYAWSLVCDVCCGQQAIKEKGIIYLPQPNPSDKSPENTIRYKQYLARAVFYNATGRTLQGLIGAAFRKDPAIAVPKALDYVTDDIDGAGVSVYQQSQATLKAVLGMGRHLLLADYPMVTEQTSRAQMSSGTVRSTVVPYRAQQVINWRTTKVGAKHMLTLLVLDETAEEVTPDGFGVDHIPQYRVLRHDGGNYTQEIWRRDGDKWALYQAPWIITDGAGRAWDEIPATFVGASNNDHTVDPSPMYDMAEINIAHYRNSADYEDSAFFVGQAQPWMSGLSESWRDHLEKTGIYIGSRSPILLPEGGQFGIAQAQPNTLAKEAMDQKEQQMIALGARLIQPGTAVKTATESQGEQEANHSVLSLACANVSEAYTKALGWAARFMNVTGEIEYSINQDFTEHRLDPQMLVALIGAWQSGQLPSSDLWGQLRKYGVIDGEKTDEEIREEVESQTAGLGLDAIEIG